MVRLPDLPGASAGVWQTILPLQLIPARGRKRQLILNLHNLGIDCNLSPQGDGNSLPHLRVTYFTIATYPRKGTETVHFHVLFSANGFHYNISPQGDGNVTDSSTCTPQMYRLQHIPARGRKQCVLCLELQLEIATYPRKRTETESFQTFRSEFHYNISPQGDGNIAASRKLNIIHTLQHIPARGRKPVGVNRYKIIIDKITMYPRKGTETGMGCRM